MAGGAPTPVIIIDDHVESSGVVVEWCVDKDRDGFGDRNQRAAPEDIAAEDAMSYVTNCADCDDTNPKVYPNSGAVVTCDQLGHQCMCDVHGDWVIIEE